MKKFNLLYLPDYVVAFDMESIVKEEQQENVVYNFLNDDGSDNWVVGSIIKDNRNVAGYLFMAAKPVYRGNINFFNNGNGRKRKTNLKCIKRGAIQKISNNGKLNNDSYTCKTIISKRN